MEEMAEANWAPEIALWCLKQVCKKNKSPMAPVSLQAVQDTAPAWMLRW